MTVASIEMVKVVIGGIESEVAKARTLGSNFKNNVFSVPATQEDETSLIGKVVFQFLGYAYYLAKKYQARTTRYSWEDRLQDAI